MAKAAPWTNQRWIGAFGNCETGAAWLSSARVVKCWVKSRNERNPYPLLPAVRPGTQRRLPVINWRKVGMTSSHHGPYDQGYTRATMAYTKRSDLFFSPFPHGTGSLSVSQEYLALEDGPPIFRQDTTCPALLFEFTTCAFWCTGLSPCTVGLSRPFH